MQCRWGETMSLNCGHQWACCSYPRCTESHSGMIMWGEIDISEPRPSVAYCSSPGECEWRAVVMMIPAGDNPYPLYKSSLAVLPAETSEASRRNGRRNENSAYSVSLICQRIFTCRKILQHGTSGFTSHPKEGVLRIFIVLKKIHRLGRV
jgi:hypothetical protein